MSNNDRTVVSKENYFNSVYKRAGNALKSLSFWREFIAYFILGSMGLWLPAFLALPGASKVFDPVNVLTFGVVTLFITLEARFFMSVSDDDKSAGITKLIVLVGVFLLGVGFVKGIITAGSPVVLCFSWVHICLLFTIFIWFINHVNTSQYDEKDVNNMLGGNL